MKMKGKIFNSGDLVWAKMKGYSFWPARIEDPPASSKTHAMKKPQHYVMFFGTNNYAWIPDEKIISHSELQVKKAESKKVSSSLKDAIEQIKICSDAFKTGTSTPQSENLSDVENMENAVNVIKPKIQKKGSKIKFQKAPIKRKHESLTSPLPPPKRQKTNDIAANVVFKSELPLSRIAVIKPLDDTASTSKILAPKIKREPFFSSSYVSVKSMSETVQAKSLKPTQKKIGFLGLGRMGENILKNFLRTGHKVVLWNRTLRKCEKFKNLGVIVVNSPAEVVAHCVLIFSCVSGPEAAEYIVAGKRGIIEGLEQYQVSRIGFVEMTSMDPMTSRRISDKITGKGCRYLEAPISGSTICAEEGSLVILASGDCKVFNECESCFYAIAKHAYFLGSEVGSASQMNLIASMLIGTTYAALGETLALLERLKLNPKIFMDILKQSPHHSNHFIEKGTAMLNRNFFAVHTLKYQLKNSLMAWSLSDTVNLPMPVTAAAIELYKHAALLSYSDHDVSAVYLGAKY